MSGGQVAVRNQGFGADLLRIGACLLGGALLFAGVQAVATPGAPPEQVGVAAGALLGALMVAPGSRLVGRRVRWRGAVAFSWGCALAAGVAVNPGGAPGALQLWALGMASLFAALLNGSGIALLAFGFRPTRRYPRETVGSSDGGGGWIGSGG